MPTSALLKSGLHTAIARGLFNEIQSKSTHYYYFSGKTLSWENDADPPYQIESFKYDLQTRNEIITMKEIKSTDVAFVVPRVDWTTNTVYDMFDDRYSDEVQGINLVTGGFGYSDPPTITITGGGGTGAAHGALVPRVGRAHAAPGRQGPRSRHRQRVGEAAWAFAGVSPARRGRIAGRNSRRQPPKTRRRAALTPFSRFR